MIEESDNPYLKMPLDRVRQDALNGVRLARIAWRERDPDGASKTLGKVLEPHAQVNLAVNETCRAAL